MNKLFSIARRNDGAIIWSEEQIQYIINHYQENFSTGILAEKFSTSTQAIRGLLRRKGIKVLNRTELNMKDFPRNSNYFNKIDSFDKAYWLGFLYADGYISKDNEIRINLKREDEEHLRKFLRAINAKNHTIKYSQKKQEDKIYYQAYCHIRDNQMVKDLANLGCVNNKSLILTFPNEQQLPKEFQSHFIRGYFDGDGSITFSNKKCRISFVGTQNMLLGIQKVLDKENLALEKHENFCRLSIMGNRQLVKILSFIYLDSYYEIELNRKRTIYNNFLLQRVDGEPTK